MDKVRVTPSPQDVKVSSIEADVKYIVTDGHDEPIDTIQGHVAIPVKEQSVPWYEYVWRFLPLVYQVGRIALRLLKFRR